MHVCWHRRDLRPRDDRALAAAATEGPVVPVFVVDPVVLEHAAPPRVAGMCDALTALRRWYRERGSDLFVCRGDPESLLVEIATTVGASGVTFAADYSGLARERDRAVTAALEDAGFEVRAVDDALVHEPGSITTNEGDHYSVFSYFWRKWRDREKAAPVATPSADDLAAVDASSGTLGALTEDGIPTPADLGFETPEADVPTVTHQAGRDRLRAFCDDPIYAYDADRDQPAADATSRLSVHLKWGTVGPREVCEETRRAADAAPSEAARESVEAFRRQLAWREFYAHVLAANPETVREPFRAYERPIEWRDDPEAFAAWTAGETGYPIVDAGMRQLRAEAWMHNRVRMIVASFLTKDLLIDWRRGYDWFRRRLADHDTANDVGGWQWASSTGTDAQPYFRIFNPATQCERHDPEAAYVHRYVPELRSVAPAEIHRWPDLPAAQRADLAPEYPDPIVNHAEAREATLEAFERARAE